MASSIDAPSFAMESNLGESLSATQSPRPAYEHTESNEMSTNADTEQTKYIRVHPRAKRGRALSSGRGRGRMSSSNSKSKSHTPRGLAPFDMTYVGMSGEGPQINHQAVKWLAVMEDHMTNSIATESLHVDDLPPSSIYETQSEQGRPRIWCSVILETTPSRNYKC